MALLGSEAWTQPELIGSVLSAVACRFILVDATGAVVEADPNATKFLGAGLVGPGTRLVSWNLVGLDCKPLLESELRSLYAQEEDLCSLDTYTQTEKVVRRVSMGIGTADGRRVWVRAASVPASPDRRVIVFEDIGPEVREAAIMKAHARLVEHADSLGVEDILTAILDELELLTDSTLSYCQAAHDGPIRDRFDACSTRSAVQALDLDRAPADHLACLRRIWAEAMCQERPVIHNDLGGERESCAQRQGQPGIVRALVVPVLRRGRVRALFGVANKPSPYDEADLFAAERLADLSWELVALRRNSARLEEVFEQAAVGMALTAASDGRFLRVNRAFCSLLEEIQSSQAKLTAALESMNDAVAISDAQGYLVNCNEAFARFYRFKTKQECPRFASEYVRLIEVASLSSEPAPVEESVVARALRGETASNAEYSMRRRDTGEGWIGSYAFAPIRGPRGDIVGSVVVARDITEQKRAEAVLKASEEKFQRVFQSAPALLGLSGLETGEYIDVNEALCKAFGFARVEILGKSAVELGVISEADYTTLRSALRVQGRLRGHPLKVQARRGRVAECLFFGEVLELNGRPALLSILTDVTEMREAERALQESSERFRQISEAVEDWIWEIDPQGLFTYSSPTVERLLGYKPEELVGKYHYHDVWPDVGREFMLPLVEEIIRQRLPVRNLAILCEHRNGKPVSMETTALPILAPNGELLGYRGVARDVTEREFAHNAIRESERRFRGLFEHLPVAVFEQDLSSVAMRFSELRTMGIKDLRTYLDIHPEELAALMSRGRIREVNGASLKLFGAASKDDLIRSMPSLGRDSSSACREGLVALFEGKSNLQIETPHRDMCGNTLDVELRLSVVPDHERDLSRVLLSFTDLTSRKAAEAERQRLEREIHHLQRLESMGRLASGVSHDMNNVLGAIMAIASVLKTRQERDPVLLDHDANLLIEAAVRGRDLVKGLRDFSRKELASATELDLNELAEREAALLERTMLKRVSIVLDLCPKLPRILGDASSIQNALLNLCLNATDAMPGHGTLTLGTRDLGHGFVEMVVEDDGEGMAPEVLARALEPFFSTKPAGKGTGLGLSQVYGTVKAHGGSLDLASSPGRGTRVSMTFPAAGAHTDCDQASSVCDGAEGRRLGILLVDDEELIRGTVLTLLQVLGHNAQAVSGGAEALKRIEEEGTAMDLVILDVNMPNMDGVETFSRLRELDPELPVLLATGFVDDRIPPILARFANVRLLKKPFTMTELQNVLAGWL